MASSSSTSTNLGLHERNQIRASSSQHQYCDCNSPLVTKQWTSRTKKNPNKRFKRCAKWGTGTMHCDFFGWVDPPLDERYKEAMYELHLLTKEKSHEDGSKEEAMDVMRKELATVKGKLVIYRACLVVLLMFFLVGFEHYLAHQPYHLHMTKGVSETYRHNRRQPRNHFLKTMPSITPNRLQSL